MTHHLGDQRVVGFRQSFLLRGPLFLFLLLRRQRLLPLFCVSRHRRLVSRMSFSSSSPRRPDARRRRRRARPRLCASCSASRGSSWPSAPPRGSGASATPMGFTESGPGPGRNFAPATVAALRRRAAARGFHRASHREGARCGREAGRRGRTEGPELGARVEARRASERATDRGARGGVRRSGRATRRRAAAPRRRSTSGAFLSSVSLVASAGSGGTKLPKQPLCR